MLPSEAYRWVKGVILKAQDDLAVAWEIGTDNNCALYIDNSGWPKELLKVGEWACLYVRNSDSEVPFFERTDEQMPTFVTSKGGVWVSIQKFFEQILII